MPAAEHAQRRHGKDRDARAEIEDRFRQPMRGERQGPFRFFALISVECVLGVMPAQNAEIGHPASMPDLPGDRAWRLADLEAGGRGLAEEEIVLATAQAEPLVEA